MGRVPSAPAAGLSRARAAAGIRQHVGPEITAPAGLGEELRAPAAELRVLGVLMPGGTWGVAGWNDTCRAGPCASRPGADYSLVFLERVLPLSPMHSESL